MIAAPVRQSNTRVRARNTAGDVMTATAVAALPNRRHWRCSSLLSPPGVSAGRRRSGRPAGDSENVADRSPCPGGRAG